MDRNDAYAISTTVLYAYFGFFDSILYVTFTPINFNLCELLVIDKIMLTPNPFSDSVYCSLKFGKFYGSMRTVGWCLQNTPLHAAQR